MIALSWSMNGFAAFSATKVTEHSLGGLKVQIWDVSFASVTSGETATGLQNVIFASYQPETSDDHGIINLNSATASETQDDPGSVFVSSVTSDDNGVLLVIGN